jgi:hypothetical protein
MKDGVDDVEPDRLSCSGDERPSLLETGEDEKRGLTHIEEHGTADPAFPDDIGPVGQNQALAGGHDSAPRSSPALTDDLAVSNVRTSPGVRGRPSPLEHPGGVGRVASAGDERSSMRGSRCSTNRLVKAELKKMSPSLPQPQVQSM